MTTKGTALVAHALRSATETYCLVGRASVNGASDTMVTEDKVLNALDKPRKLFSIQQLTDPSGSSDALQILLMKMRDAGKVAFDIKKGA